MPNMTFAAMRPRGRFAKIMENKLSYEEGLFYAAG